METSKSGQPIYKYENKINNDFIPPVFMNKRHKKKYDLFIENNIGKIETVFHEILSENIHLDIYIVAPRPKSDFYTLITAGMSNLPMNTPKGHSKYKYAELMISLPKTWKLEQESFKDFKNYWPIYNLKWLARFVHDLNTWLGHGHTIPNGNPPEQLDETVNMSGFILLPSIIYPKARECKLGFFKTVHLYALHPLYTSEMNYKLDYGVNVLLDKFDEYKVSEVVDIDRKSVIDD